MKKHTIILLCLLTSITMNAQSWKQNADRLMVNNLASSFIDCVDIFSFPEMLTSTDTLTLADGSVIHVPYPSCYGYFIDLQPFANWSHPCQYYFVDASMNHSVVSANMPPNNNNVLVELSLRPRLVSNPTPVMSDTVFVRNSNTSDTGHKWAVLICANGSEQRFWFDLSSVYTVLTNVYGYQEKTPWEGNADRRVIVTAPDEIKERYRYDLHSSDLNGNGHDSNADGTGDFFNWFDGPGNDYTIHSKQNIKNIFRCFAGDLELPSEYIVEEGLRELTEEDQLFIYITGHGMQDGQGAYFPVKEHYGGNSKIYDYEFVDWLKDIKCSQMTLIMQNCHSGGFIEKFLDDISNPDCLCKNRIGQSATDANGISFAEIYGVYNESSRAEDQDPLANDFTYYWASAALGYYPYYKIIDYNSSQIIDKGPWTPNGRVIGSGYMNWSDYFGDYENTQPHSQYDKDPDTDNDGVLSLHEIFVFANNLDTWSKQGYYYPNQNDTLGQPFDYYYELEIPQQSYESSFTKEAATIAGYEGQINDIADSGTTEQPYRLCGDIWIDSDSKLTMYDEIHVPENTRIYIKPSGKLVLDGGKFSNMPEERSPMWIGVQVWGNKDKHQCCENGRYWQGILEMKNGATIQNATIGVDVWNPFDDNSTGGIVKANDAVFYNNATAVCFHPYENQHSHPHNPETIIVRDNSSYFKNCEFVIDHQYIGPVLFEMHVNLFRVRGVSFHGCDFKYKDNAYSNPWPIGLHAYDAGFKLGGIYSSNYIYPSQVSHNSSFEGFYKAVVSVNDGSAGLRPFLIKNTVFNNNCFGVFAVKSGFATIMNSSFRIGRNTTQCAAGIFLEQVPNFIIEQDTFCLADRHPDENYGIVIKNSKSQNLIYKNIFHGLYCANLSVGRNNTWMLPRNSTDAKASILGLEYRCNENSENLCDFYVQGGNSIYKLGIQTNQGAQLSSANNTFSYGSMFQFVNYGNYGINYYYNPGHMAEIPDVNSIFGVTLKHTKDTIGCPSHYDLGNISYIDTLIPVLPETQKIQRTADYYNAYEAYNAIKDVYYNRIDGGNTNAEVADIQYATFSNMWSIRSQLLNHSPYLTTKVLTKMAEKPDVFPRSVMMEILTANPDELKNDTLINYLQNMNEPFPDYLVSILQQIANGVTVRTAMESQLAKYSQDYRKAAGDMIRTILYDTIIDKTALVCWLGNMEDIEMDREIINLYLEDNKFEDAIALANLLPTIYGLKDEDLDEHNEFMTLLQLYSVIKTEDRNTMQLDSLELSTVEYIAEHGVGVSQAMAKSIMMGAYGYRYNDCPNSLDLFHQNNRLGSSFPAMTNEEKSKAMGLSVDVSPNPANSWTCVDYRLPEGVKKAHMKINNIQGATMAAYDLHDNSIQKTLDLRDMPPGIYTYTVFCGTLSTTGKLVIVK